MFSRFLLIFAAYLALADGQRCINDQVLTQRSVKLTCINGFFQPTACLVQEKNDTIEVAINTTRNVEGFWIKCQMDGNTIRYVKGGRSRSSELTKTMEPKAQLCREPRCIVDGKQYHINDSLKTANVVYKCLGTTIEPLGCYFVNSNGQEISVKLGQTLLLDNVQHRCRPGNLNSSSLQTSCIVNGTTHQVGEKWDGGRGFMQECTSDGFIMVSDCIVEPGINVKIGQTLVHKNYLHSCIRTDSGVRYNADPCNLAGVVCTGTQSTNQTGQLNPTVNAGQGQCKFEGHILKVGEKYPSSNNGFLYQCSVDGSMVISDCTIVPGLTVEVGKSVVYQKQLHKCIRNGDSVKYTAEPCGPTVDCSGNVAATDIRNNVSGCIADDNTKISVGTVYRLGKSKLECQKKADGKVSLISEICHGEGC